MPTLLKQGTITTPNSIILIKTQRKRIALKTTYKSVALQYTEN